MRRRAPALCLIGLCLLAAGCGNTRQQPTGLGQISPGSEFLAYTNPKVGISFGYPQGWTVSGGSRPLLARVEQGDALASIYLYPRTDLPTDAAGIEAARTRLLASLHKRAPGFEVSSSTVTELDGAPAIQIRGKGRVGSRRVETLATHVYKPNGEYVVDAYATPAKFDRAEKIAFGPLLQTLRVTNPEPPESAG